jgi:Holliday junction resolvase RusA-like endonuclease
MLAITFKVQGCPPWKQGPADKAEGKRQSDLRDAFLGAVKATYTGPVIKGHCSLNVLYCRAKGRMDSANIVGGIADALQKHVYANDQQVVSIAYVETDGDEDWYQVSVVQLG